MERRDNRGSQSRYGNNSAAGGSRPGSGQRSGNQRSSAPKPRSEGASAPKPRSSARAAAIKQAHRDTREAKKKSRMTGVPGEEVSQKHDPVMSVYQFSPVDYSQIARIAGIAAGVEGLGEVESLALGRVLAGRALATCDVRLTVSVDDGTDWDPFVVGALFARSADGVEPPADAEAWENDAQEASDQLLEGSRAAREALRGILGAPDDDDRDLDDAEGDVDDEGADDLDDDEDAADSDGADDLDDEGADDLDDGMGLAADVAGASVVLMAVDPAWPSAAGALEEYLQKGRR